MTTSIDTTSASTFAYPRMTAKPVVYIIEFDRPIGAPRTFDWETGAPKTAEQMANPARCTAQFYIGWTDDMGNRFHQHVTGKGSKLIAAAIKKGVNVNIAVQFECETNEQAWKLEKVIKGKKATAKIIAQLKAGKTPKGLPEPTYIRRPVTVDDWMSL